MQHVQAEMLPVAKTASYVWYFLTVQLLKSGVLVSLKQRIRGYILYPECMCRRKHAHLQKGNTGKVRREIKYVKHKCG